MTGSGDALDRASHLLGEASARRAIGWRVLALSFYEPDVSLVESLRTGQLLGQVQQAVDWLDSDRERFGGPLERLSALTREYAGSEPDSLLHELRVQYARLFIGPDTVLVPPYESVYRDRDEASGRPVVMGPTTVSIDSLYRSFGLRRPDDHRDLPDHVATELEFLYFLCQKEAEAWRSDDLEGAKDLRRAQRSFLGEHLGQWWPAFAARLAEAAPDGLYRVAADLGTEYLAVETGAAYADGLSAVYATGHGTPESTDEGPGPIKPDA